MAWVQSRVVGLATAAGSAGWVVAVVVAVAASATCLEMGQTWRDSLLERWGLVVWAAAAAAVSAPVPAAKGWGAVEDKAAEVMVVDAGAAEAEEVAMVAGANEDNPHHAGGPNPGNTAARSRSSANTCPPHRAWAIHALHTRTSLPMATARHRTQSSASHRTGRCGRCPK